MYKKYYTSSLKIHEGIQDYSDHGQLFWPDVTEEVQLEVSDDSKRNETQQLIANVLQLSDPAQIIFASSSHEFIHRVRSCFDPLKKISILTTDSEFHGLDFEAGIIDIEKVSTHPFDNFESRFIDKIKNNFYDVIFFSHVFFNSGMAIKNLKAIVDAVTDKKTIIIIDGSHGFMQLPTDLSTIESRIFYLSGAYKHAQPSEGCYFLHIPKNSGPSLHDGRFTELNEGVYFSEIYCLNAVLNLFQKENITVEKTHAHIQKLQRNFREHLLSIDHHYLAEKNILNVDYNYHGHFLTFAMPSPEHAKKLHDELLSHKIITDCLASRLRFCFGIYQNEVIDLNAMKIKNK